MGIVFARDRFVVDHFLLRRARVFTVKSTAQSCHCAAGRRNFLSQYCGMRLCADVLRSGLRLPMPSTAILSFSFPARRHVFALKVFELSESDRSEVEGPVTLSVT